MILWLWTSSNMICLAKVFSGHDFFDKSFASDWIYLEIVPSGYDFLKFKYYFYLKIVHFSL